MTSLSPLEQVAVQSHADVLEEGVQQRLLADDELAGIVGERIRIVIDPLTRPPEPLPMLTVATPSESRAFELNSEAEVTIPLGIGIWYSETRYYREPGEKSVKSLVNLVAKILMGDQRLDQPPLGPGNAFGLPDCLAESIRRMETVDYGTLDAELDEAGELICADLYRLAVFNYTYGIDAITGAQA